MAETKKSLKENNFSRRDLTALAKVVLCEEMHFVKPNNITWLGWDDEIVSLSHDVVKYATVEAFLAYKMGSKLLT
jgi:hypothetical protein